MLAGTFLHEQVNAMYQATGLTREQFGMLVATVRERFPHLGGEFRDRAPHHALTFERRMHLAWVHLRRNIPKAVLADFFDASHPTASRIITELTPAVVEVLREVVPTGDDLDPRRQLIVDGTLCPCWSCRRR